MEKQIMLTLVLSMTTKASDGERGNSLRPMVEMTFLSAIKQPIPMVRQTKNVTPREGICLKTDKKGPDIVPVLLAPRA